MHFIRAPCLTRFEMRGIVRVLNMTVIMIVLIGCVYIFIQLLTYELAAVLFGVTCAIYAIIGILMYSLAANPGRLPVGYHAI